MDHDQEVQELITLTKNLMEIAERSIACATILARWGIERETQIYANAAVDNFRIAEKFNKLLQSQCDIRLSRTAIHGIAA